MAEDDGNVVQYRRRRKPRAKPGEKPEGWKNAEPEVTARGRTRARGYKWEPFRPGNEATLTHGAGSRGKSNLSARGRELAEYLGEQLLGGDVPPHLEYLLWPQFRGQVEWWATLAAKEVLLRVWLEQMPLEEQVRPPGPNAKSPFELWLMAGRARERAADKLGLTPAAWAKIQRDLGLAHKAEEDRLSVAAQAGAEIRARRRTVVVEADEDGDGD